MMNRRCGLQLLVFVLPLALALVLSLVATRQAPLRSGSQWLKPVQVGSVDALEQLFTGLAYDWPLTAGPIVPRLLVKSLPSELNGDLSVSRKKALFLRVLLPVILAENQRIRQQRVWLQELLRDGVPDMDTRAWQQLQQLADDYRVKGDLHKQGRQQQLLLRVDEVPVALVLAQAANESGWGTSRFVQQANNLFGHWTYRADQGLVPLQRDAGKRHRVRIFPTLRSSVRSYLHNLNTSRAYRQLRELRAALRDKHQPLDSGRLAGGLINYSERGAEYVEEIRDLIRSNHLEDFEGLQLRQGTWRMSTR